MIEWEPVNPRPAIHGQHGNADWCGLTAREFPPMATWPDTRTTWQRIDHWFRIALWGAAIAGWILAALYVTEAARFAFT